MQLWSQKVIVRSVQTPKRSFWNRALHLLPSAYDTAKNLNQYHRGQSPDNAVLNKKQKPQSRVQI